MNIMNDHYFFRINNSPIKKYKNTFSQTLDFIHRLLFVISVYLVFGLLFQHVYASTDKDKLDPYRSQHGSVWLLPDDGVYIEAMQMQTDVDYEVTGHIARATVKQQFRNTSSLWAEGLYVFPLPENAAVDRFRMVIGERIIEGQVKERIAAKKSYERARSAGKKASLIEQQRPNVFTTSLANIAPGEEIILEFEFQQTLDYKEDSYRLRFPMVVGPRYHAGQFHTGKVYTDQDNTEQASIKNITKPAPGDTSVYTETSSSNKHQIRIHVSLDAGVSLYDLNSSYHRININQTSESRYVISTTGESMAADRDFELVWKPQLGNEPKLSVFNEIVADKDGDTENYAMVSLLPPDLSHLQQKVQSRDVVFVIDVSGSMAGTSIEQAKSALITALDGLSEIDRFNIIWFNDNTDRLFAEAVSALPEYKNYAKRFIDNLQAGGGTEMLPAMKLALSKREVFSRFRQVIFLTDGNISNETELFSIIDKQLADSRLFTIGIGSAPNAYFMRKAAHKGRGTFTYIGDLNEVHDKTTALLKKLETPALINVQLDIGDRDDAEQYDIYPKIIPDLYAGEPLTVLIKGRNIPASITLKGDYGNTEWQNSVYLSGTEHKTFSKSGIRIAWAREKIASLMSKHHESEATEERQLLQQEVTDTALRHHLVSRYTSLLAVDVTPVNANGMLYRERMKNNLPHGWNKSAAGSGLMLAQTSTGSRLNVFLALLFFITAMLMRTRMQIKNKTNK